MRLEDPETNREAGTSPRGAEQGEALNEKINQIFAEIAESYDNETIWKACTKIKSCIYEARIDELLQVKYALTERKDDYLNLILDSRIKELAKSK